MTPYAPHINKMMFHSIRKTISIVILFAFISTSIKVPAVYAQVDAMPFMPTPGAMVNLSPEFTPAYLKGIVIHPENALKFDFIVYKGDTELSESQKKQEYTKLTKYFLASLAIPDDDQWVNLSPYEKDRIIKDDFGKTEMGRDLLAQDYMLKQITASLIYPEGNLGKKFWDRIYSQAQAQFGTSNIPVNTFNKVWILPDDALIYEKGNTAYVLKNHLRVMLEEDYLSLQKHAGIMSAPEKASPISVNSLGSKIVRQIILPELEREVNEGKNFAPLRQVYSGMLLAAWYKHALKESFLSRIYANKAKVKGVDQDPKTNERIYRQYLKAYKKGVFNFIKEDVDKYTNETIPRKYFSGGGQGFTKLTTEEIGHNPIRIKRTLTPDQAMFEQNEVDDNKIDYAAVAVNVTNRLRPLLFAAVTAATIVGHADAQTVAFRGGQQVVGENTAIKRVKEEKQGINIDNLIAHDLSRGSFLLKELDEIMRNDHYGYADKTVKELSLSFSSLHELPLDNGHQITIGDTVSFRDNIFWPVDNRRGEIKTGKIIKIVKMTDEFTSDASIYIYIYIKADKLIYYFRIPFVASVVKNNVTSHNAAMTASALADASEEMKEKVVPAAAQTFINKFSPGKSYRIYIQKNFVTLMRNIRSPNVPFMVDSTGRTFFEIPNLVAAEYVASSTRVALKFTNSYGSNAQNYRQLVNPAWLENEIERFDVTAVESIAHQMVTGKSYRIYVKPTHISEVQRLLEGQHTALDGNEKSPYFEIPNITAVHVVTSRRLELNYDEIYSTGRKESFTQKMNPNWIDSVREFNPATGNVIKSKAMLTNGVLRNAILPAVVRDRAMPAPPGGIDLSSANLAMVIKRDGKGVPLPFAQQDMAQLNLLQGLDPVILSITPAQGLPLFTDLLKSANG